MEDKYYYDLHCHTNASFDSPSKIKDIVKLAKKRGLDGIAITDHNKTYKGPFQINGIDIIPGNEINTKTNQHLLAYFIDKDIKKKDPTLKEAVSFIKENNGYAVLAHPLRSGYQWINEETSKEKTRQIISLVDGLETGNASDFKEERDQIKKIKENHNDISIFETAGSDGHMPGQVGFAVVRTNKKITKENFAKVLSNAKIIVRPEAENYRKESRFLEKIIKKVGIFLKIYDFQFARKIFFIFFVRNYSRIKNIKLSKIDFNYKK